LISVSSHVRNNNKFANGDLQDVLQRSNQFDEKKRNNDDEERTPDSLKKKQI
jgi:hypothetical protein